MHVGNQLLNLDAGAGGHVTRRLCGRGGSAHGKDPHFLSGDITKSEEAVWNLASSVSIMTPHYMQQYVDTLPSTEVECESMALSFLKKIMLAVADMQAAVAAMQDAEGVRLSSAIKVSRLATVNTSQQGSVLFNDNLQKEWCV